jgi:hypothetical protein
MPKPLYITLTIEPSGFVEVKRDQPEPTLADMQKAVGGLIQSVDYGCPPGVQAYVNEEGWLLSMEPNPHASRILKFPQALAGTAFVRFKDTSKRARKFFGV